MNSTQKQYLPGLDLLKFILAVLIVSGHCQLFVEFPTIQQWWGHLTSIAVPLFFGISAFLFFRKIYSVPEDSNTRPILIHSIKRLTILFLCWYVLMIPITYFQFFSLATFKETIFAFFLSCSLRGYWFIKALIINSAILYVCRKKYALILCTIIALIVYFYCSYNYIYNYNSLLGELHPYYSFYYHTIAFCIGAWLARAKSFSFTSTILFSLWLLLFVSCSCIWMDPVFRIVSILFIFPIFFRLKIRNISPPNLKIMRGMSIIYYMVQFALIWLYDGACNLFVDSDSTLFGLLQFSLIRFTVVILVATGLALLIIHNESRFRWLKYLH